MNGLNDMEQIDIKKLIDIVLERIVSIIVITILFGLVAFGLSKYFLTPKYQSEITMIVDNRKSTTLYDSDAETKTLTSDITASQQLVPTYIEMIKSRNVLQAVADRVENTTGEKYTYNEIKNMTTASSVANTEILRVTVELSDAAMAREIAETIADVAPQKIQQFIERSDVKIIDNARISTSPVSPNTRNNTILGALFGMLLSLAFILLRELFDVRVKSADDLVNKFGIPVLGAIPEIYIAYDENYTSPQENDKQTNGRSERRA